MVQVVPMVVVPVVAVERTVTAVPVPVKAAVQMGTGGTEGVDSGSPVVVGVAAGAAGRVARGVRNRNDASVESIEGGDNWRVETKGSKSNKTGGPPAPRCA